MLQSAGALAVAELAYWVPAFILSVWICIRHGFKRQLGWVLLCLLGLCRLIGASCTVANEQLDTPNSNLIAASAICNSIGLSFLISAIVGLLTRVQETLPTKTFHFPPFLLRLLQLLLTVGIVISIVGSTKLINTTDASDVSEGRKLTRVGTVLFAVAFAAAAAALALILVNLNQVHHAERKLVYACIAAFPFLFVRLVYSLVVVFAQSKDFNSFHPNIYIQAFMAILMEFIVAAIIIAVGILTPVVDRHGAGTDDAQAKYQTTLPETHAMQQHPVGVDVEQHYGRAPAPPPQQQQQRQQRQQGRREWRGGPVTMLVRAGIDKYQQNR